MGFSNKRTASVAAVCLITFPTLWMSVMMALAQINQTDDATLEQMFAAHMEEVKKVKKSKVNEFKVNSLVKLKLSAYTKDSFLN